MKTYVNLLLSCLLTTAPTLAALQQPAPVTLTEAARTKLNQSLIEAVVKNNLLLVRTLLGQGANPNTLIMSSGGSLLHLAAATGKTDLVRALLDKGASAVLPNAEFDMPSDLARKNGHTALVALLKKAEEGKYIMPTPTPAPPSTRKAPLQQAEEARRKLKDYNYVKQNFGRF